SIAGPRRPQDRVALSEAKESWAKALPDILSAGGGELDATATARKNGNEFELHNGSVVIAAITSCTNTSNPEVMLAAGLLARNAVQKGLKSQPWVKTSLAPGSKVVTDYLAEAGLQRYLDELGFELVGYGCTTCIGNSGPVDDEIADAIHGQNLVAVSVLSGNRNFDGRINPDVRANYLMSPPLVVAYAIAGRMDADLVDEPLGVGSDGEPVYLRNIWPTEEDIDEAVSDAVRSSQFRKQYSEIFDGGPAWSGLPVPTGELYEWDPDSTYVKNPPYFEGLPREPEPVKDITGARVLVMVGDSVTTDHISPAGNIAASGPAGKYLQEHEVPRDEFNSYGSRRGNHEVMMRGTFANIRLRNLLAPGTEGGVTRHLPDGATMPIYDAAMKYRDEGVPLIAIAGQEYGTGSSRDWAAKGTILLGIDAVIAESFERIHRSNLVGMGVLPLQFLPGESRESLGLTGEETYSITGIAGGLKPGKRLVVTATDAAADTRSFEVICRIDTPVELDYYEHGGILQYVLRQLLNEPQPISAG
ncbi:MAG TPA: aconitate hydratase AcnA, partial [Tepidiformaceae bacterium]|nr:aconitate hydratase AcnA [Tepidiformaceae bacterium]